MRFSRGVLSLVFENGTADEFRDLRDDGVA
jgi:hypothetical protein